MALMLSTNNLNQFYGITQFAHKPYYNQLDIECSRRMIALTVSRPSPQGRCFIELRLDARFFSHYDIGSDDQIVLHRTISPQLFFTTLLEMRRCGRDFMILYLTRHLDTLSLSFSNLSDPHDSLHDVYLPFLLTYQDFHLYRTLSTIGVIFPPHHPLQSVLVSLNNDSHVTFTVTLTTPQAKFTARDHMGRDVGFILSIQRGECLMQDVVEGEETQIVVVLNPIESFNNIISQANPTNFWVGIGKSNNNNRGLVHIRRGYATYVFYSTE